MYDEEALASQQTAKDNDATCPFKNLANNLCSRRCDHLAGTPRFCHRQKAEGRLPPTVLNASDEDTFEKSRPQNGRSRDGDPVFISVCPTAAHPEILHGVSAAYDAKRTTPGSRRKTTTKSHLGTERGTRGAAFRKERSESKPSEVRLRGLPTRRPLFSFTYFVRAPEDRRLCRWVSMVRAVFGAPCDGDGASSVDHLERQLSSHPPKKIGKLPLAAALKRVEGFSSECRQGRPEGGFEQKVG